MGCGGELGGGGRRKDMQTILSQQWQHPFTELALRSSKHRKSSKERYLFGQDKTSKYSG